MGRELYVTAFRERCALARRLGQPAVDGPGVIGLLPGPDAPAARLLVTDDRAHDWLAGVLPGLRAGMVTVYAEASRCHALLEANAGWRAEQTTALVRDELATVPALALPATLALRPVRRLFDDPVGGVVLEDAAGAALRADPDIRGGVEEFSRYLRSLPAPTRLFAAVDGEQVVRATSGFGVFGTIAGVMFVNTDSAWRRRGVASAMTAAALHAARSIGARQACLDATAAGLSIYRRLGFEVVTPITRFFRG